MVDHTYINKAIKEIENESSEVILKLNKVSISGRSETIQPTIKKTINVKKVNSVRLRGFVVPLIILAIWRLVGTPI